MSTLPEASNLLTYGFITLAIGLVSALALYLKSLRVLFIGSVYLVAMGLLGHSGWLTNFSGQPPRILMVFLPVVIGVILLGLSPWGLRLTQSPYTWLIGYQAFRIPVEYLIHRGVTEGIAPPQMSWHGMNYDVITGITALLLIPIANRLPRWAIAAWNIMGLGLLVTVVTVAILSFPTPFQRFTPDNTWVTHFPYIWLPTILVSLALLGHVLVYRKLTLSRPV